MIGLIIGLAIGLLVALYGYRNVRVSRRDGSDYGSAIGEGFSWYIVLGGILIMGVALLVWLLS